MREGKEEGEKEEGKRRIAHMEAKSWPPHLRNEHGLQQQQQVSGMSPEGFVSKVWSHSVFIYISGGNAGMYNCTRTL